MKADAPKAARKKRLTKAELEAAERSWQKMAAKVHPETRAQLQELGLSNTEQERFEKDVYALVTSDFTARAKARDEVCNPGWLFQPSRARAFLMHRLLQLGPPFTEEKLRCALVEQLKRSDVPLPPEMRQAAAELLDRGPRALTPDQEVAYLQIRKNHLQFSRGMMAGEAEMVIAKERGMSVQKLRKLFNRPRKRTRN